MIIAGFESSTPLGGVALLKNNSKEIANDFLVSASEFKTKSHSEVLNSFLNNLLTKQKITLNNIDYFALGIGPGSFTGLRVSVNLVKTLAYSLNKKIIPINTLHNLAATNFKIFPDIKKIRPMINAYKNMVYTAEYKLDQGRIIEIEAPSAVRIQNLVNCFSEPILCVGDGLKTYEDYLNQNIPNLIHRELSSAHYPSVETTAQLALETIQLNTSRLLAWNEVVPLYIRASEAEENQQGIKFVPL